MINTQLIYRFALAQVKCTCNVIVTLGWHDSICFTVGLVMMYLNRKISHDVYKK